MVASLVSGMFIERHGAIRVSQVCVLAVRRRDLTVAAGTAYASTALASLALAPLVIGLGYGPDHAGVVAHPGPHGASLADGADVLDQADRRAGGARACGRLLPVLALQMGWHAAFARSRSPASGRSC
jgi:hypothetical protein